MLLLLLTSLNKRPLQKSLKERRHSKHMGVSMCYKFKRFNTWYYHIHSHTRNEFKNWPYTRSHPHAKFHSLTLTNLTHVSVSMCECLCLTGSIFLASYSVICRFIHSSHPYIKKPYEYLIYINNKDGPQWNDDAWLCNMPLRYVI